jgi:predicted TIM-barrel fold metal-dependent hydrolase
LGTLGLARAVLVQPSVYGSDNTVLIDALAAATVPVRGIAVVSDEVTDAELARLDQAGVRGLRFNLVDVAGGAEQPSIDSIRRLADRVAVMDWHVELLLHVDEYPDLEERFTGFPVEIVLGHMGYPRPGAGPQDPGFLAMMRLARQGLCWIKLTGPYRLSRSGAPYPEAAALVAALVDTAPNRLLWGTDWPHVMVPRDMPNDGDLCDLLAQWIPDADLRRQILVLNPAALYGFEF